MAGAHEQVGSKFCSRLDADKYVRGARLRRRTRRQELIWRNHCDFQGESILGEWFDRSFVDPNGGCPSPFIPLYQYNLANISERLFLTMG